jgi:hypothetical protein
LPFCFSLLALFSLLDFTKKKLAAEREAVIDVNLIENEKDTKLVDPS